MINPLVLADLLKRLWVKVVVEILITLLLFIAFFVMKNLVPKKYRIKDKNIKDFLKFFNTVMSHQPKQEDGIITLIGKSVGMYNALKPDVSVFDGPYMQSYADKNNLKVSWNSSFAKCVLEEIVSIADNVSVVESIEPKKVLLEIEFGSEKIFAIKNLGETDAHKSSYSGFIAHEKGYNYLRLTRHLKKKFDNRIYLSKDNYGNVLFSKLDHEEGQENFIEDAKLLKMEDEIRRFKEKGISRNYILYGPPGCGKTTSCIRLSEKISDAIIKMDSYLFRDLAGNEQFRQVVENIEADVYIVDDIDRVYSNDIATMLYGLEAIKGFSNKPILLATLNDINKLDKAMIRPGRFDDIVEFFELTPAERFEFVKQMALSHQLELKTKELEDLSFAMHDMSKAYIKEYCLQIKNGLSVKETIQKIETRKMYITGKKKETEVDTNDDGPAVEDVEEEVET